MEQNVVNLEGIYNRMKVSNIVSTVNGNIDQTARDWLGKDLRNIMDKDRLFEIIWKQRKSYAILIGSL